MADDSRQLLEVLRLPLAQLPHALQLPPPPAGSPVHVVITPPGSKSLSNRALLLAALSTGTSTLRGALLDADDAQRMLTALTQLGACINATDAASVRVTGVGGMWPTTGEILLNLNNAGTATRFLAGCATLARHAVTIDGNARMRERPIGELATVLRQLGCVVSFPLRDGYPPMRVEPAPLTASAKEISVGTTQSSQFISAVLLAAAFLPGGVLLRSTGSLTSESYVRMSLGLLAHLGANVQCSEDLRVIRVRGSLECDVQGTRAVAGCRPLRTTWSPMPAARRMRGPLQRCCRVQRASRQPWASAVCKVIRSFLTCLLAWGRTSSGVSTNKAVTSRLSQARTRLHPSWQIFQICPTQR